MSILRRMFIFIIIAVMMPLCVWADQTCSITQDMKDYFDAQTPLSHYVTVPGRARPVMLYAQNDPLWADIRYHQRDKRRKSFSIGGTGCEPTSMAIIYRYLFTDNELMELMERGPR